MATTNYSYNARLFHYHKRFSEALKRGQIYWPGEHVKKFGLMSAEIEPMQVKDANTIFEWGEVVKKSNGRADHIEAGDGAGDFYGVVSRNASATGGVYEEQVMGMAPRQTISVFRGGRSGVIAMPVQNINDGTNDVPAVSGGKVYVRIAESTGNPDLPIGGIETVEISGETVEWEGVTFDGEAVTVYHENDFDAKYTDSDSKTTYVAPVDLG